MTRRCLLAVVCAAIVWPILAQQKEATSIDEAFKNGSLKGTIGHTMNTPTPMR